MCHGRTKICPGCRVAAMPREERQLRDWRYQDKAYRRKVWWYIRRDKYGETYTALGRPRMQYYLDMSDYYRGLIESKTTYQGKHA